MIAISVFVGSRKFPGDATADSLAFNPDTNGFGHHHAAVGPDQDVRVKIQDAFIGSSKTGDQQASGCQQGEDMSQGDVIKDQHREHHVDWQVQFQKILQA